MLPGYDSNSIAAKVLELNPGCQRLGGWRILCGGWKGCFGVFDAFFCVWKIFGLSVFDRFFSYCGRFLLFFYFEDLRCLFQRVL